MRIGILIFLLIICSFSVYAEPHIIIKADNLTNSDFSINSCTMNNLTTQRFKLNCTGGYDVARARMHKTMFYGTNGADPKSILINGLSRIYVSDSRDVGKQAYYLYSTVSQQNSVPTLTRTTNITFSDTTNNFDISSWSWITCVDSQTNVECSAWWYIDYNTARNGATRTTGTGTTTIDETELDLTADEVDNVAKGRITVSALGDNVFSGTGTVKTFLLSYGNATIASSGNGGSFTSTDFLNQSIPIFLSILPNVTAAIVTDISGSNYTFNISVIADDDDADGDLTVIVQLEPPIGLKRNITLINSSFSTTYINSSFNTEVNGTWNFTVFATDSDSNINSSFTGSFEAESFPVNITNITLTSPIPDQILFPPEVQGNTTDPTPTYSLTTDTNTNCFISTDNSTWNDCSTTGETSHICTESSTQFPGILIQYFKCNTTGADFYRNVSVSIIGTGVIVNLDGESIDRKYEFGTTANITFEINSTDTVCLDIFDDTRRYLNQSCALGNSSFNYTIDKLVVNEFNDSTVSKNVTYILNLTYIILDNRTDLIGLTFNITGYNSTNPPENFSIDIGNDGIIDAIIPGKLRGNNYVIDDFIFNNIIQSATNITFETAEKEIIQINITGNGDRITNGSLNFTITGFNIDSNNEFSYDENFSIEIGSSFSLSSNINLNYPVPWDYFTSNTTFNKYIWGTFVGSSSSSGNGDGINVTSCSSSNGLNGGTRCLYMASTVGDEGNHEVYPEIDFRKFSQIDMKMASGSSNYGGRSLYLWGEDNDASILLFSDGTSNSGESETWNSSFYWSNPTTIVWAYHKSGAGRASLSKDISSLSGPIRLVMIASSSIDTTGGPQLPSGSGWWQLHQADIYGVGLNSSNSSGITYLPLKVNWTSDTLFEAPSNIERTKFTVIEMLQDDITDSNFSNSNDIIYWLTNDNGTTWEQEVNDSFHSFSSSGSSLKIRAELTSTNSRTTPIITNLIVQIVPSGGCSLEIDIGEVEDGTIPSGGLDMNIGFGLDNTTTPISYNGTDANILDYPCNDLTCNVPIYFKTNQSCLLQISDMNYTKNPNPLNFTNMTPIETQDPVKISFILVNGIIEVKDLALDFLGNKNITAIAFKDGARNINDSQIIQAKYSKYNITIIPSGRDEWDIGPNVNNPIQTNIPPYGNYNGIGNPFFKFTSYSIDPMDLYLMYNSTLNNSCTNTSFSMVSSLNITNNTITINDSAQQIFNNASDTNQGNISTLTNLSCSYGDQMIMPYFRFIGTCTGCFKTTAGDGWELMNAVIE